MDSLAINFGTINEANVEQLRMLNSTILPVSYNDKFYSDILLTPECFTKFAYWNGFVVGAVCCRVEDKDGVKKLYIMTLGVLKAYRTRGIGRKLLDSVLEESFKQSDIQDIYLHVHTENEAALRFYKKLNFEVVETIPNYYKTIDPPDCYKLSRPNKES